MEKSQEKFKRQQAYLPMSASTLFPPDNRIRLEKAIDYLNSVLIREGLSPMPLSSYEFYRGAPAHSLRFKDCTALNGKIGEQNCAKFVQMLNDAQPKFKLKFRRDPKSYEELENFVRSSLEKGDNFKSWLSQAWESFVPLMGDPLQQSYSYMQSQNNTR